MHDLESDLLEGFELHAVAKIRAVLDAGLDLRVPIRGQLPVDCLLEMYTRSDRFPECLQLLLERGAMLADPKLRQVLLDDADGLAAAVRADRSLLQHQTTLRSAFTSLDGGSLLHVAAEYGHLRSVEVLLQAGADVDARAAVDAWGLGGHTPLFHTVNANGNRSAPVMQRLLAAGADAGLRLPGLHWGRGFEWETTFFDVTPISFAQFGLLPQVHRDERAIYDNVRQLLLAAGRAAPDLANVPNRYLQPRQAP